MIELICDLFSLEVYCGIWVNNFKDSLTEISRVFGNTKANNS